MQPNLIFDGKRESYRPKPVDIFKPGTQNFRLYQRLLEGPVSNVEIVLHMKIFNSTGRLSEVREKLRDHLMDIKAERAPVGGGIFYYSLRG